RVAAARSAQSNGHYRERHPEQRRRLAHAQRRCPHILGGGSLHARSRSRRRITELIPALARCCSAAFAVGNLQRPFAARALIHPVSWSRYMEFGTLPWTSRLEGLAG